MVGVIKKVGVHKYEYELTGEGPIYMEFLSLLAGQEDWTAVIKEKKDDGAVISAAEIRPLKDLLPMDYTLVEKMILHLGMQMQVLKKYKRGVFFFNLADIIVIDKEFFFLGGLEKNAVELQGQRQGQDQDLDLLSFTYPMKFTDREKEFFAPELNAKLEEKVLPFTTFISVGYYSLAKLCLYCLQLTDVLDPLQGSKMYFFLERCLKVDPTERYFLYI
jgi:hypothetical protein